LVEHRRQVGRGIANTALDRALEETGVWTEGEGSDLYLIFSGLPGNFGQPIFEFHKTMSAIPGRKVFLRDLRQAWWLCGISDAVPTLADLISLLSAEAVKASRVITLGSSAGGFGALLLGTMLDADLALAFSPQTYMDREHRMAHGERRWGYKITDLCRDAADIGLLNLGDVITPRRAVVWSRRACPQDQSHMANLIGIPNIQKILVEGEAPECTGVGCLDPCTGHDTAMALKTRGDLLGSIERSVNDLG